MGRRAPVTLKPQSRSPKRESVATVLDALRRYAGGERPSSVGIELCKLEELRPRCLVHPQICSC